MNHNNLLCGELSPGCLQQLLQPYKIEVHQIENQQPLPGSFWGDPEAGLVGNRLYIKAITPVQSALHEACHYICMDQSRRHNLDTNAGGDYDEENAVCYLQILFSKLIPECGYSRMLKDMDNWGYSFRLGSARAWFEQDADDARQWLENYRIIDKQQRLTGRSRI